MKCVKFVSKDLLLMMKRMIGVRCVAAPIFNSHKEVVGVIGISGLPKYGDEK